MSKKLIIVFEGIEGSGKSLHIKNVANFLIRNKNKLIGEYDLFAFEDVKKLNVFSRLLKSINFLIWGDA